MSKKLTTEEFILKANLVHFNGYDYSLTKYSDTHSNVEIICSKHGIFKQRPLNHLSGQGCPVCGEILRRKNKTLTFEMFVNRANNVHLNKYDYSNVVYVNAQTKIIILCLEHGEFKQVPNSHLNGKGCPICGMKNRADNKRLGNVNFINKSKKTHGELYDYSLANYITAHQKVKIICHKHGIFEQKPSNHIWNKQGCPVCKESKGEKKIGEILNKLNVLYVKGKTFQNCVGKKRKLPFDFYLLKQNLVIEYDGRHHFEIINAFGGKRRFEEIRQNDIIKNEFLLKNNINLIRISYRQYDNLEKIICERIL